MVRSPAIVGAARLKVRAPAPFATTDPCNDGVPDNVKLVLAAIVKVKPEPIVVAPPAVKAVVVEDTNSEPEVNVRALVTATVFAVNEPAPEVCVYALNVAVTVPMLTVPPVEVQRPDVVRARLVADNKPAFNARVESDVRAAV